ncbi:sugar ABC transporter permease [Micrococcales bacterium 31B]|nr:sugar ABC transporter permease [Micrococcales bacterium 31B]
MLAVPTVYLVALALTQSSLARPLRAWVGLDNFTKAAASLGFGDSLWKSVLFAVLGAALQMALGTLIALALRSRGERRGGLGLVGVLLLLPLITPPVIVGTLWKLLLAPEGGWFASLLAPLGVEQFNPLGSPVSAFASLLVVDTWQWTPFVALLVYASLLGLDVEIFEAAALDGASAWRGFTHIALPLLSPALLSVALIKTVLGLKVFDLIFVVTQGGPGVASLLAPFAIYRKAFRGSFQIGQAAAMTLMLCLVVTVVVGILQFARARALRVED